MQLKILVCCCILLYYIQWHFDEFVKFWKQITQRKTVFLVQQRSGKISAEV